ncbi:hypothetical protein EVAR_80116_1 [Eumeta japonica]|uniref:Uncharacterized protein n=1 Tax=Eumeta variegata TaxID=151549 RepID=A0A4C1UCP5_EUMVA|nr:hypothetical protein EVAR_80116_1 [Eumeta japonica]
MINTPLYKCSNFIITTIEHSVFRSPVPPAPPHGPPPPSRSSVTNTSLSFAPARFTAHTSTGFPIRIVIAGHRISHSLDETMAFPFYRSLDDPQGKPATKQVKGPHSSRSRRRRRAAAIYLPMAGARAVALRSCAGRATHKILVLALLVVIWGLPTIVTTYAETQTGDSSGTPSETSPVRCAASRVRIKWIDVRRAGKCRRIGVSELGAGNTPAAAKSRYIDLERVSNLKGGTTYPSYGHADPLRYRMTTWVFNDSRIRFLLLEMAIHTLYNLATTHSLPPTLASPTGTRPWQARPVTAPPTQYGVFKLKFRGNN